MMKPVKSHLKIQILRERKAW